MNMNTKKMIVMAAAMFVCALGFSGSASAKTAPISLGGMVVTYSANGKCSVKFPDGHQASGTTAKCGEGTAVSPYKDCCYAGISVYSN
jgi:uncharacterized low-complexity protein